MFSWGVIFYCKGLTETKLFSGLDVKVLVVCHHRLVLLSAASATFGGGRTCEKLVSNQEEKPTGNGLFNYRSIEAFYSL